MNRGVAVTIVCKTTEELRSELDTEKIFLFYQIKNKQYKLFQQRYARDWLEKKFIKRFDIRESNGNLAVLTYHNFRHQIGTDLLNNGMTPFEVKEHLGHESMHSTRLYAKVRDDRLTKGYKKLGFIGVIEKDTEDIVDKDGYKIDYS